MNNLTKAIDFVKRHNVAVFPVWAKDTVVNGKEKHIKAPCVSDPFGQATTDEEKLTAWWNNLRKGDADVAFATYPGAVGLAVVDVDRHRGNDGEESLRAWETDNSPLPDTFSVRTPTGGRHLWFKCDGLNGGKDGVMPSVDIHGGPGGKGRYVLLPGQVITTGSYVVEEDRAFAEMPKALVDFVNQRVRRASTEAPAEPQEPAGAAWCDFAHILAEVRDMKPLECGKRDNTLIALCLDWKERGVTPSGMVALMETMNDLGKIEAGDDPLDTSDFRRISASAWKNKAVFGSTSLNTILDSEDNRKAMPKVYSAKELAKTEVPPVQYLIEGFLPKGVSVIGGAAKSGKTYFNLMLAVSVAAGIPLLDTFAVPQARKVLYCYLEGGQGQVKRRLRELYGEDFEFPEGLLFMHNLAPLEVTGFQRIREVVEEHHIELVIIDTWQKVRVDDGRKSGNAYQKEYKEINRIGTELFDRCGVSVLLTHHLKQLSSRDVMDPLNTLNGSAAIGGAADCIILLNRERNADTATLEAHGRDIEDVSVELVKTEPMGWRISAADGSVVLTPETDFQRKVVDALRERPEGATAHEVAAAISGAKYNSVAHQLARWAKAGKLDKSGKKYRLYDIVKEDEDPFFD